MLESGAWIASQGARVSEISSFQGLEFRSTPRNPSGRAFEYIPVRKAPGYNSLETGSYLYPFTEVFQVYNTQNVDGSDWSMTGPGEWVEARKVAVVTPKNAPPVGVAVNRWIDVDLAEQTLAVYEDGEIVFATVIASGLELFWAAPACSRSTRKKPPKTCATAI
jgi:hypothetical protein